MNSFRFGISHPNDDTIRIQADFPSGQFDQASESAKKASLAIEEGTVVLTKDEAAAIYELIDGLSGGNPFAHDGTDSLDDPTTSVCVKLYKASGHTHCIPKNLQTRSK